MYIRIRRREEIFYFNDQFGGIVSMSRSKDEDINIGLTKSV